MGQKSTGAEAFLGWLQPFGVSGFLETPETPIPPIFPPETWRPNFWKGNPFGQIGQMGLGKMGPPFPKFSTCFRALGKWDKWGLGQMGPIPPAPIFPLVLAPWEIGEKGVTKFGLRP